MDNHEKNTYAKKQITNAFLKLLEKNSIENISISKIADCAGVSRMTFYRNYEDKTDILRQHLAQLLQENYAEFLSAGNLSGEYYFGALFGHFKTNRKFYLTLFQNDLGHLLLEHIVSIAGPKPEHDNTSAYRMAYFAYGLYGWIREWAARGMPEDTQEITAILQENGGKLI